MDSIELQQKIFERIEAKCSNPKTLKIELAALLNISKGAVYKRINGSTALTLGDLTLLMKKYSISLDNLINKNESDVTFKFPQMQKKVVSFFDYAQTLETSVEAFASLPDPQIYYSTNELPFFYYFLDNQLTYFKFFIYAKTVWNLQSYKERKFNLSDFNEEYQIMESLQNSLQTYYNELPNIEFWNENVLNNTLNQITYFLHAGYFELPEEAFILCDRLAEILEHVEKMAEHGVKFLPGKEPLETSPAFNLYYNEISHTNNMLLIVNSRQSAVFTAYDNPNYIISTDENLVEYTLNWFQNIQRSSQPISKDAEITRKTMFSKIHKKIDRTRSEIETILSE